MIIVDEWRKIAARAWSIRLAILSTIFTGVDVAIGYLAPAHPSRTFAVLAGFASAAAVAARLIQQSNMTKPDDKPADQ